MTLRLQVLLTILMCAVCFYLGVKAAEYYADSTTTSVKETTKNHTITTTITTKQPDGTTRTEQTIDSTTRESTNTEVKQVKPVDQYKRSINLLVANDFSKPQVKIVYGLGFSMDLLPRVPVGVFGLSNGMVGASIGWRY